jgi:hypothetical protein
LSHGDGVTSHGVTSHGVTSHGVTSHNGDRWRSDATGKGNPWGIVMRLMRLFPVFVALLGSTTTSSAYDTVG